MRRLLPLLLLAACTAGPPQGDAPYQPTPGMETELRELQRLRPQPDADLTLDDARRQPRLLDAARAIYNVRGEPFPDLPAPQYQLVQAEGVTGPLTGWLYKPKEPKNTPLILMFAGGGFATPDLDAAGLIAGALAQRTGDVVIAVGMRPAPGARFPATHADAARGPGVGAQERQVLGREPGPDRACRRGHGGAAGAHHGHRGAGRPGRHAQPPGPDHAHGSTPGAERLEPRPAAAPCRRALGPAAVCGRRDSRRRAPRPAAPRRPARTAAGDDGARRGRPAAAQMPRRCSTACARRACRRRPATIRARRPSSSRSGSNSRRPPAPRPSSPTNCGTRRRGADRPCCQMRAYARNLA